MIPHGHAGHSRADYHRRDLRRPGAADFHGDRHHHRRESHNDDDKDIFSISKIMSYYRTGLPIVCEESVYNADMVVELNAGYLFKKGDIEDCYNKIQMAIDKGKNNIETIQKKVVEKLS